ncbi:hypothetical protein [Planctobacterium marinum]|uniref:hypothetical protein n=1 Tax=Planctobacterium marinum TaxID=1631968 RepID=UPI001E4B6C7C|nr:hypothetical protein [Planctobacterium marinum]MCC2606295.1 hypothetical protein [Planctobacterium marinum]
MNRSSKGFGLTGVLLTVIVLIVSAIISTSVSSKDTPSLKPVEHKTAKSNNTKTKI